MSDFCDLTPSLPVRWLPVSTRRSSSPCSTKRSTWLTTCWPGSTSASASVGCQPSPCPICPPTARRSDPASWTCGQCPPPLAMERESPLLGGFITASFWMNKKKQLQRHRCSFKVILSDICMLAPFHILWFASFIPLKRPQPVHQSSSCGLIAHSPSSRFASLPFTSSPCCRPGWHLTSLPTFVPASLLLRGFGFSPDVWSMHTSSCVLQASRRCEEAEQEHQGGGRSSGQGHLQPNREGAGAQWAATSSPETTSALHLWYDLFSLLSQPKGTPGDLEIFTEQMVGD